MNDLQKYAQERIKNDPEFAQALEDTRPELEIMRLLVEGRHTCGLTQNEVAQP